ncbi:unnamed protein product [Lathyrus oleraceus]|uniref:Uncharacterized protein n=1 Tax=Pisum sativum TaxID=3888 RepID=A0A9D4XZC4_PEA|nr:uncharacterized protein LOC127126747 [Pisum sativum]KAI5427990.1 hypothetical protein KIW84_033123 [Pisum sativum]
MANLHRIFPLTIIIFITLLAFFTSNTKTVAGRSSSFIKPTCMFHACIEDLQNNLRLSSSPPHSFHRKARVRLEDIDPRHYNYFQRYNDDEIARLVPSGPNPLHNLR